MYDLEKVCPFWATQRRLAEKEKQHRSDREAVGSVSLDFAFLYLFPIYEPPSNMVCGECWRCQAESKDANHIRLKYVELMKNIVTGKRPKISIGEYYLLRCNSYEYRALFKLFDDETMRYAVYYIIANCRQMSGPAPITYDESAIHFILPYLLDRALSFRKPCFHEITLEWEEILWCRKCGAVRPKAAQDIAADEWTRPGGWE